MASFTFSADEVRAAPSEVRRWIEAEVVRALAPRPASEHRPSAPQQGALAVCTLEEMAQVLKLISENIPVTRVFFELARESAVDQRVAPFHALSLPEILRHAQLTESDQLFGCLGAINQALQTIRDDAEASMFGFDEAGHLYLHEATHRSIRHIWEQLTHAQAQRARAPVAEGAGAPRFVPVEQVAHEPVMKPEHAFSSNAPFTTSL